MVLHLTSPFSKSRHARRSSTAETADGEPLSSARSDEVSLQSLSSDRTRTSMSSTQPSSILKSPSSPSSSLPGKTSHNEYGLHRLSIAERRDNRDSETDAMSITSDDSRSLSPRSSTTPGTSVSSLSHCPAPLADSSSCENGSKPKFPFCVVTLSSTSTLQFIVLPIHMRVAILEAIRRAWPRGVSKSGYVDYAPELMQKHRDKGCAEGAVWEVHMKGECWVPRSEERVASKRILLNLFTEFAKEGYFLNSSFRTSAKDSGKDTMIFQYSEPDPEPAFFSVAFHSSDRIWIIDAEADVGEALEEGIKNWWTSGIRDTRTREKHCREIRLKGTPWTSHSTASLISARCIHLVIMKTVTHACDTYQYEYTGAVNMVDKEEGEMPATFYRRIRRK